MAQEQQKNDMKKITGATRRLTGPDHARRNPRQ